MRPPYLSGERFYLRAPDKTDYEVAVAWFPSIFPANAVRAEAYLKDALKTAWGPGAALHLIVARIDGDEVVGGVVIEHPKGPDARVEMTFAPSLPPAEIDLIQAEVLRILVPWLQDEAEVLVATFSIGADQPASLTAADELGLERSARLREFLARPGGRADLILCQFLNHARVRMNGEDPKERV